MRALIYDPYLDTAGGGERYMLTAASIFAKKGYKVDVWWKDQKIGKWLEGRIGIDLSNLNFIQDLNHGVGCDLVFWLSDGSIPMLFGKKNIIHFQTPFTNVAGKSLFNRLKRTKIDEVICNSQFTKRFIDQEYGVDAKVIYPPINTQDFKSGKKENIILYVGRYSQLQQLKRQDILVDTFKKMVDKGLRGWRLVLIGGSEVGGREFVQSLKSAARGYSIDILENLPLDEVKKYYAKAKIFWSASGYGVDEESKPSQVEHFGMSIVEAQSAGCIPIVIAKGGHKEIIETEVNGYLWTDIDELINLTSKLVKDERRRKEIAKKAQKTSEKFSVGEFTRNFEQIIF